jgi:hypothetical protein
MELRNCFTRFVLPAIIAAGVLSADGGAQARTAVLPDSQVEADVLRSLASASDLSSQSINTTTISGTVTLSGSVQTEAQRRHAEQLASTTRGVQKVVDELTLGSGSTSIPQATSSSADTSGRILQSDGTYAIAANDGNLASGAYPQNDQQASPAQQPASSPAQQQGQADVPPPNGPDTDPYGRPLNGQQPGGQAAAQGNGYPGAQQGAAQPSYGQQPYGPPPMQQRPPYGYPQQGYAGAYGQGAGQPGGQIVTVPAGTLLRVRVNQHLSSRDINVGTPFDAMVENDIVADGQVAIPRGAFVQGTVVDAESSGHLKGRGELGLQLRQVTLGGKNYPIVSDTFSAHGGDKTIQTVNSTVGLGALGAIFGAVAGGGAGAAIGAGVGGAVGLGSSAASGRGDVFIPSEAVLSFRLTQPASVTTVSQAEMQRLAYGAPLGRPQGGPQFVRRYPYPYYGPVYYGPRFYRPYGYYVY